MNRNLHKTKFSARLGAIIAVAETARACDRGTAGALGGSQAGGASTTPRLALLAAACAMAVLPAWATPPLPAGGSITVGSGSISQNGSTLTINQSSQQLTTNWQSFDIAAGHSVVFAQPNASSVALNRVVGADASRIYGSLSANGKVFLVNPNGVLFASGAQVSVGGLVAATLALADDDFAAGRYRFTGGAGAGSVVNEANVQAGSVVLIGPKVVNNGAISTPAGRTTLVAGDRVTVSLLDGLLTAQVDASVVNAEIQNHGRILAEGGNVSLLAGRADTVLDSLINVDGVVRATRLHNDNGRIVLDGGAGGAVSLSGMLDASAPSAVQGGSVSVLGDRIALATGAAIDVSGAARGGTALIGGDYRGSNTDVMNARLTTVDAGAVIRADGTEQGGRVIVWSNDTTQFGGSILASGKGFAEVSGKGKLQFSGVVNTGGGTLLLDPTDITVQAGTGNGTNTFSGAQLATLLAANDVVLNADNNITWNNAVALDYNGVGTRSLTLEAGNSISYRGIIRDSVAGGDKLNVIFNSDRDANGVGGITLVAGATIATSGGDVVLRGGNAPLTALPAFTDSGYAAALSATAARRITIGLVAVDAGGGNITLRGEGASSALAAGISLNNARLKTSGSGTITIDGLGAAGSTGGGYGVQLTTNGAILSTADGALVVQGVGRGTGTQNSGLRLTNGILETTGNGTMSLNGLGATGGDNNDGIVLDAATLRVFNGKMVLTGTGRGTGLGSDGIELANGALVEATGSGDVSVDGTSTATGANTNRGVAVWAGSTIRTASGALALQGSSADPAKGAAISLESSGVIGGAGQSGALTLTGDTINLASGQILGAGTLLLQPLTPTATIGLGDGASGTFNLASSAVGLIQNGFSSITIGRGDGSGAVDVRTVAFADPVVIRTPAAAGSIAVNGTLSTGTGTSLGSITLQAGGDIALNGATVDTADALTLVGGAYAATGSSTLKSNTLVFGNNNAITDSGVLTLNQGTNTTIANAIGGSGSLVQAGMSTTTLTADNSYAGATTVSAGTLQVGSNGATGTLGGGAVSVAAGANLVFNRSDSVSLSTLSGSTSGIAGTGNVTALIGGDLTVDRAITLSGAGSSILLEAGKNNAAIDASGGDVKLLSNVATSVSGTVTIFSGHADTATHDASIGGANGSTRYKTYGVSAVDTSGAVAGTRNFYYRQQPTSLAVSGLTASKVYDGLVDGSTAINASTVTVSGIDGDIVPYSALTLLGASFDSAHAGTRLLNAAYSGPTSFNYSSGGAAWSVSGYAGGNVAGSGSGLIAPRPVSGLINAVGKAYDGTTRTTSIVAAPSGFVSNDSAAGIGGFTLAFDNPNAGARNVVASGSGTISGFAGTARGNGSGVGAGNEVAGVMGDYMVVAPAPMAAVISPVALTVTANNDAKIVTQTDQSGYNGVSFTGFVNGESASNLGGTLAIVRSNGGTEAAGSYAGVLVPSGYTSGNYRISYANGDYRIVPASELLVRIQNVSSAYGATPTYSVSSAQYLDQDGGSIHTLTPTAQNGNTFTFSDGIGGSATFTITPTGAVQSGAGVLAVGNYGLAGSGASTVGGNFTSTHYVGNQAVNPIALTPLASGVSKTYDGTTGVGGLTMDFSGKLAGDQLTIAASGTYSGRNVGSGLSYTVSGISIGGPDARNYYLASDAVSGSNGVITPRSVTVSGLSANDKIYDGTTVATLATSGASLNGLIVGDVVGLSTVGASATFDSRNVGAARSVAVSGLTLEGSDASNYQFAAPATLTASITPRPLTVVATPNTKIYDGNTTAAATPLVSGGLVAGDSLVATEAYAGAQVGTALRLVPVALVNDGNGGSNYTVALIDSLAGEIRPPMVVGGGGIDESARLNGDRQVRAERSLCAYEPSARDGNCGREQGVSALVDVVASGLRLPAGTLSSERVRWEASAPRSR